MKFDILVCTDNKNGIGRDGEIPWKIKEDITFFKHKTTTTNLPCQINAIIMGRITAESIGYPLKDRINIVISRTQEEEYDRDGYSYFRSLDDALKHLATVDNLDKIFVIGGQELYTTAVAHKYLQNIYITKLEHDYKCDRFFTLSGGTFNGKNGVKTQCRDTLNEITVDVKFMHLQKEPHEELQYLELMERVIKTGEFKATRNGNTWSLFGGQMTFDLRNGVFPLITTKRVPLRLIFEEKMFFLRGQTDVNILKKKNVHIWDDNTTEEFIKKHDLKYQYGDKAGQYYEEGDLGPMYGWQFRNYGAKYCGKHYNYKPGEGFDQLAYVINLLKTDQSSRRIMMTSYNPVDAQNSVLYPCHGNIIQFNIGSHENIKYLNCQMTQRSADEMLGLPFNISSYSLLVYILCEIVNNAPDYKGDKITPGKLVISLGDMHVYEEHINQVKTQLERQPYEFPKLKFNKKITSVDDIEWENVVLENYKSHEPIKAQMVA
ncbi:MAG: bifunctional dihydrofolate reductase/thymidylate synthase [Faunusvirus sp.]|jgi:dihydrofolate reductase/thymidylate synthase|uniref:Bifunctional dihydrofolate reductase/thymidylate synthase n=1 Tax=Faunusvirus sp. TaxID=2487766 RepID=A0A3G4ZW78_9VIRU|nr:MAG: bifunctional dihydrofolate reductase/thymidylate synthase [Faunusvirus sp.]